MSEVDTSTKSVERLAEVLRSRSPKNSSFGQRRACEALLALAAERATLQERLDQSIARERALLDSNKDERTYLMERNAAIEDAKRFKAERDTIAAQLAEARNAALEEAVQNAEEAASFYEDRSATGTPSSQGIDQAMARAARACARTIAALKSEPAPRQSVQDTAAGLVDRYSASMDILNEGCDDPRAVSVQEAAKVLIECIEGDWRKMCGYPKDHSTENMNLIWAFRHLRALAQKESE